MPTCCGPRSAATTCGPSRTGWPWRSISGSTGASSRCRCSTAWAIRRRWPSSGPAGGSASTCRMASSCRAWPISCGGCSRTRRTIRSCGQASSSTCRPPRSSHPPGRLPRPPLRRRPIAHRPEPISSATSRLRIFRWRRRARRLAGRSTPSTSGLRTGRRRCPWSSVASAWQRRARSCGAILRPTPGLSPRSPRQTPGPPGARSTRRRPRWPAGGAEASPGGPRSSARPRRSCGGGGSNSPRSRSSRSARTGARPMPTWPRRSTSANTTPSKPSGWDAHGGSTCPARKTRPRICRAASPR